MPLLNRAAILDIAERGFKTQEVPVPEWGTGITVKIRELSTEQFQKLGLDMGAAADSARVSKALDYTYDVVVWATLGTDGEPLFAEGDQKVLREKGKTASFYAGLTRIANEVYDLSGLTGKDEDESPN